MNNSNLITCPNCGDKVPPEEYDNVMEECENCTADEDMVSGGIPPFE